MTNKINIVSCRTCGKTIKDGEGRINTAKGQECMKCYSKPKLVPLYTKIAGYNIPTKMLEEYRDKVEYTRHSAVMGKALDDPRWITRALEIRVQIHKKIFKITGHDHDSTEPKPMEIRKALEEWLESNIMTHVPEDSLL
ncbi:MAG: hypothetical protein ACHQW9_00080 [Nitrososphaerales archaeon]